MVFVLKVPEVLYGREVYPRGLVFTIGFFLLGVKNIMYFSSFAMMRLSIFGSNNKPIR